jgi:hypothetical protein
MSIVALRILLFVAILGLIAWGARRIWRDWRQGFRDIDRQRHSRDLAERGRPDVITLRRDTDGTYRRPEDGQAH